MQIQKKMASSDMISQLQSGFEILSRKIDAQNTKIDAQSSRIEAKIDVQNSKINVLIVIISIIGTALTIAISIN